MWINLILLTIYTFNGRTIKECDDDEYKAILII